MRIYMVSLKKTDEDAYYTDPSPVNKPKKEKGPDNL